MILSTSLAPMDEPAPQDAPAAARRSWAAWRWGALVTLFLVAQLGLAYAAVTTALSDGGERPLSNAEARVMVTDPTADLTVDAGDER